MSEPFDYSQCEVGDSVEVSTQLDFSNPAAGTIAKRDNKTVNIVYLDEQGIQRKLMFCWHESDERCKMPGRFDEAQRTLKGGAEGPPQTGIFRLTRNQNLLQGLHPQMAVMERLLQSIVVRLSKLEEVLGKKAAVEQPAASADCSPAIPSSTEPTPTKRKPGRPRKHAPAREVALT